MSSLAERPCRIAPAELQPLLGRMKARLSPTQVWLFGSRARGDNRPDSDWDLLAVLADDAPDELIDPMVNWEISRDLEITTTLLSTTESELRSVWGLPNTIGYDLAREGVRLLVD